MSNEKIYNINLTLSSNTSTDFFKFCQTHNIKFNTTEYDLADPTKGWKLFTKAEALTFINNHNSVIPKFNHTGLYFASYGKAKTPLDPNVFYIGESTSLYHKFPQTGALKRLQCMVTDFKPDYKSNHTDKFYNKRDEIAFEYGNGIFDLSEVRFAVRPHELACSLSKEYSLHMEANLIQEYIKKNNRLPICNTMYKTNS